MRKWLCFFLCMLLTVPVYASSEIRVIFPSAGTPYTDELMIALDAGGIATADFPDDWNMLGDSLHLPDAETLFIEAFQNIRYHTQDRGYGLVMRNQMIAFQYRSAGVVSLEIERIQGDVNRLELEISGFTRLSLETMPRDGAVLYMFYGVGGARVTLNAHVIVGDTLQTPEKVLLQTEEKAPQPAIFFFEGGEVRISATMMEMDAFLERMPVSRPVPTGMDFDPISLIDQHP